MKHSVGRSLQAAHGYFAGADTTPPLDARYLFSCFLIRGLDLYAYHGLLVCTEDREERSSFGIACPNVNAAALNFTLAESIGFLARKQRTAS